MVGIILESLEGNEKATEIIDYLNQGKDAVLFVENLSRPHNKIHFSYFPSHYIWNFQGTLISTSIQQAEYVNRIARSGKHYYYVWDLDWLRPWGKQFHTVFPILKNTELICRSIEHKKELEKYTQKTIDFIMPSFDLEKIVGRT